MRHHFSICLSNDGLYQDMSNAIAIDILQRHDTTQEYSCSSIKQQYKEFVMALLPRLLSDLCGFRKLDFQETCPTEEQC